MDHDLELIQSYPGNIWKFDFYNFLISWKYWKSDFLNFLISWKYWKLDFSNFLVAWKYWKSIFSNFLVAWKYWKSVFPIFSYPGNTDGGRAAPGARLRGAWIIFGTCSWKSEHGNLGINVKTTTFLKMASQAKPLCS